MHKILAPFYLACLLACEFESELTQSRHHRARILWGSINEYVGILCRVRKSEQDGARLSNEQIPNVMPAKRRFNLFSLPVLKRAHIRATGEGLPRTSAGIPPLN